MTYERIPGAPSGGTSTAVPAGFYLGPRSGTRSVLSMASKAGMWLKIDAEQQAVDQMKWEVTTVGDAASVLTAALYALRPGGGMNVDRLALTAAVSATSLGVKTASITPVTLTRGLYVVVMEATGHSATAPQVRSNSAGMVTGPYSGSDDADLLSDPRGGLSGVANATGLPTTFLLQHGGRANSPIVGLRTA